MYPVAWDMMICPQSKQIEYRKVAQPVSAATQSSSASERKEQLLEQASSVVLKSR